MEDQVPKESASSKLPREEARELRKIVDFTLGEIWKNMGLTAEALDNRREVAENAIMKLLEDMRSEEEATFAKLVKSIRTHGKKRNDLGKELGIELQDPDSHMGPLELEKFLRDEVKNLELKKEEKMVEVRELRKEDEEICAKIEAEPFYVSLKFLPTPSEMTALQNHVREMRNVHQKRFGEFAESKLTILSLLELLQEDPNSSFERQVVCEEDETFVLSSNNLMKVKNYLESLQARVDANKAKADKLRQRIEYLIEKLERDATEIQAVHANLGGHKPDDIKELTSLLDDLEAEKKTKMEHFINKTREELVSLWDMCYYSKAQRERFRPYFSIDYTESLLEDHEKEVEHLKEYYHDNLDLFNKVKKRQDLWKTMLELEEKKKDQTYLFKAKGNTLLEDEKNRKRVNKLLPKLDEELLKAMEEYHARNGKPFLVGGQPYERFIEEQEEDFRCQVEAEKMARMEQKKKTNFHETVYGSKPVTPAKKMGTLKRKHDATPILNATKRQRNELTLKSKSIRNETKTVSKHTKSALAANGRKVLGDNNASVIEAGYELKSHRPEQASLSSLTSEHFLKDMPQTALTSTFQKTPEPKRRSDRIRKATSTPKSTSLFKTPSSRILTPANRSGKKMTTSSARKVPFLI